MHSARCLSCGGHSMKAGELRKQLFYRQGNGGFAKVTIAQSQRQQRRSQDTNPGSLALGTGQGPVHQLPLPQPTRRERGRPAVPPCRLEMLLQGPRIVSPRTRIRTKTGSTFHSPQPPLPISPPFCSQASFRKMRLLSTGEPMRPCLPESLRAWSSFHSSALMSLNCQPFWVLSYAKHGLKYFLIEKRNESMGSQRSLLASGGDRQMRQRAQRHDRS